LTINGASGVVIIRSPSAALSTTGTVSETTVQDERIYTFTGSGTVTF
jgi:hypothetical protein